LPSLFELFQNLLGAILALLQLLSTEISLEVLAGKPPSNSSCGLSQETQAVRPVISAATNFETSAKS